MGIGLKVLEPKSDGWTLLGHNMPGRLGGPGWAGRAELAGLGGPGQKTEGVGQVSYIYDDLMTNTHRRKLSSYITDET